MYLCVYTFGESLNELFEYLFYIEIIKLIACAESNKSIQLVLNTLPTSLHSELCETFNVHFLSCMLSGALKSSDTETYV